MISESILLNKIARCNGCTYDNGEEPEICQRCSDDPVSKADKKSFASYLEAECEKIGSEPN